MQKRALILILDFSKRSLLTLRVSVIARRIKDVLDPKGCRRILETIILLWILLNS
mgnify:CR=1 FL=1